MNTTAFLRRLLAFVAAAVLAGAALAGQNCEPRRPTLDTMRRDLALAASVATQLDEMAQRDGSRVLLIARAGQDLSKYGLRYSHLGIAYRDEAALGGRGAWRVVHKLNQCGSSRSELYRQGLAEFFGDGLYLHEAGVVALKPELAARVIDGLKDDVAARHAARTALQHAGLPVGGFLPAEQPVGDRDPGHARRPRRGQPRGGARLAAAPGLPADHLHIDAVTRLGARVGTAHIAFDDHPFGQRMAGQIETVTVDSVFAWMARAGLGEAPLRLRTLSPPANPPATAPARAECKRLRIRHSAMNPQRTHP
jgi:hypothetical protein